MIILQSIRIRNFRAIAEVTFQPLQEGITGIVGANGAGKTTFLSASIWALFGVRPPDAPVGSLRREGSTGECSVSVVFRHMNQQVEIIRELKGGGRSNHTVVNIYVDGVEQTVASVTAADQWIATRLGIDVTGFLTAFVVRQKELDQLITATPSVRKALIERLAGVDTINAALKAAREDENQAKRILQSAYGSEQEVQDTENSMNLLADKYEQMSVNREAVLARQQHLQTRNRELQRILSNLREAVNNKTREEARLEGLLREAQSVQQQLLAVTYVATLPNTGNELADIRRRYGELNGRATHLSNSVNTNKVNRQGVENTVNRINDRLITIDTFLAQTDPGQATQTVLETERDNYQETIAAVTSRRAVLQSRIESFEESIHALGQSSECPVCHSDLKDPSALVKNFRDTIVEAQAEIGDIAGTITTARESIRGLEERINIWRRYTAETDEATNLRTQLVQENQILTDVATLLEREETDLYALNQELDEVRTLGVQARTLDDDRNTHARLMARVTANMQEQDTARAELDRNELELQAQQYDTIERESQTVQVELDRNAPEVQLVLGNIGELETSLAVAKTNYRKAIDDWTRRKDLLKRQERLGTTTDLLDRFRRDTIASLAPEISDYATSLISEMTSGEFSDIKLDDEFNASVTTGEGVIRPVSWLSGGELSAVALAIRIAIGYLITGGNPELLWLDEVLTAQDADRRSSMLSLIRTLPIDQIIMINHTAEAADIVDKTIVLHKDRDNGSYIAEI